MKGLYSSGVTLFMIVMAGVTLVLSPAANAQDLEPRRWSHLAKGSHLAALGYAGKEDEIYFNPLIGITDGSADINAWIARYSYVFDWGGKTARIDGIVPYVSGNWSGLVDGEPGRRTIRAGGDPWLRLSVNLSGAPALSPEELLEFKGQNPVRTTIGASIAVSFPLGGYDPRELINVGRNRYVVRPQVGVLHMRGAWSFEATGSVFLFGDNDDFVESTSLSQKPVYALQTHLTRNFSGGFWLGTGIAYAKGGKVDLDNQRVNYEVDNFLWNVVGGYRLSRNQSLMVSWQQGRTQVNSGSDSDSWLLSWAFAWGH